MTEKIFKKTRLGDENMPKEYKNTDQKVKDMKRETFDVRKKTREEMLTAGYEEIMKCMFFFGMVMLLFIGARILSEELIKRFEKAKDDKEKVEIIEEKLQIKAINPIILNAQQRARE